VRLALRRFAPSGSARAAVLCTHAMMVHGRYFHRFAEAQAGQGLDVFVLDWRGHGESKPPTPKGGTWTFDDYVALDLPAALGAVARTVGCRASDVAVLGHSLGGLVTLAALGTGVVRVRRVLLASTSVWLHGPHGPLRRRATMRIYDSVARVLGYAPIKRLGFGSEDEPASYVTQLAAWARTGRWTSRDGIDYLASLAHVDTPASAIVGDADGLCSPADVSVLTRRLPHDVPLRIVPGADHFTLFTRERPCWDDMARALE
jgi:alpha-beta hydrolase superfamily lysophospholipase